MTEATLNSDASNSNTLAVTFAGDWLLNANLPTVGPVLEKLKQLPGLSTVSFDTGHGFDRFAAIIAIEDEHRDYQIVRA